MKIDELIERLEKMAFDFKLENGIGDKYVELANEAAEAIRVLNAVPAADVVEVVRCKNCLSWKKDSYGGVCDRYGVRLDGDWFCAGGEKKEVQDGD